MEASKVLNYIEEQYRGLNGNIVDEFVDLYDSFESDKLRLVFSTMQSLLLEYFKRMNNRLPSGETGSYFLAEDSRGLINVIERIESLKRGLSKSEFAFEIEEYYEDLIKKCKVFLKNTRGSEIPANFDKVNLYYLLPIFIPRIMVRIPSMIDRTLSLKNIGAGSYALVFKYYDEYYNRYYVIKRAKKDLSEKELERFHREFEQMSKLNSPYIVEVYSYNAKTNEYTMEFMDKTLTKHIEQNNAKMKIEDRKYLIYQLFKAFSYLHAKEILHRDISPNNVLLRYYDDTIVLKIADFGLVKLPDSMLTSLTTDLKGCFNDPGLMLDGFQNYQIEHETYALTRLIYFIMTGRTNIIKDSSSLYTFLEKGINSNKSLRFHSVEEMRDAFRNLKL